MSQVTDDVLRGSRSSDNSGKTEPSEEYFYRVTSKISIPGPGMLKVEEGDIIIASGAD